MHFYNFKGGDKGDRKGVNNMPYILRSFKVNHSMTYSMKPRQTETFQFLKKNLHKKEYVSKTNK